MYTDLELFNIWKENPEKGTALLMEKYEKLIWSVCGKRLENPEDIKECVNDTFAEFFLEHEKFDAEKSNLKNYLCMIADRKAIDTYRKNLRRENFLNEEAERAEEKMKFSEITSQEIEKLEDALEQLPPKDRQILQMKYYDDMSYQEIGQKLGMKAECVKKRGQRSKKKLLYILLVGLLIATLIACAAVICKKFHFSDTYGYIWTDAPVYELVTKDAYVETEYLRYNIISGRYQSGHMQLELEIEWLGEDEVITKDNYKRIEEELSVMLGEEVHFEHMWAAGSTGVKKSAAYMDFLGMFEYYYVSLYVHGENKTYPSGYKITQASHLEFSFNVAETLEKDFMIMWFGIENEKEVELEFSSLPVMEYVVSNEKKELLSGTALSLGPAVAGEQFTVVKLFHQSKEESDFQLSPFLLHSAYGLGDYEIGHAILTNAQGTVYESMRISENNVEGQSIFDVYFPSIPAGEYTLKIPYACFMKEEDSQSIMLHLPIGEENYKECDETIFFSDGSGFHITGIERSEEIGTMIDADKFGNVEKVTEIHEWVYALDVEALSGRDDLQFCTALAQTSNPNGSGGIAFGGKPRIKILKEANIEEVEIYFTNPVYLLEQQLEWKITVQENE